MKFLLKRIFSLNLKQMFNKIDEIAKKTKKSKIMLFFDIVICGLKYQAGYMDYWLFEMYNLNKKQRKTVMTRGKNNSLIKKYNKKDYIHIFENKDEFLDLFKDYIKRDYLILNENNYNEFEKFCKKHNNFIAKPRDGSCGRGIEKININNDYKDKYDYLMNKKLIVLEELIIQDERISKMNPSSVNTFRIISITDNGKVNIIAAYFRIGNNKFVDNFNSGGMVAPIEVETGKIKYKALDKSNNLYDKHPTTNTKIIGFEIPMWDEIKSLVNKLGTICTEVGMVGWDIALSDKGPLVVEGNDYPGHDIYQLPPHRTNGIGMLPKFEKYLK